MSDPILKEILDALQMPRKGIEKWVFQLEHFCKQHGGDRYYSEILGLLSECRDQMGNESHEAKKDKKTSL